MPKRTAFLFLLISAAGALVTPTASAQVIERFRLHGEVGAGTMLSEHQRDDLDYGLTLLGAARVGFVIIDPLSVQASFSYWYFPKDESYGDQVTFSGGLRVAPEIGGIGNLFLDANAGLGRTGDTSRLALDAGIGFQFALLQKKLGLGPFVRYGHTIASGDNEPDDAMYVVGGVAATFGLREGEEEAEETVAAGDSDGDGIPDPDDQCEQTPAGDTPDPERVGCPAPDSDGDEVRDPQDACPTRPAGAHPNPNRPGCPDNDSDNDSVYDSTDRCPDRHQGLSPDPEQPGCPLPDRDNDSVLDSADACPDEAGQPSQDAARNGCPGLVRVEEGQLRVLRPVFFASGRDTILPRSIPVLEAIADALKATPGIRRVSIEGHTDEVGDDAYNMELSERRANNVRTWLTEHGIPMDQLESHGFGKSCPIVRPGTNRARAQNRRVVLRVVDPPMSPPTQCLPVAEDGGEERPHSNDTNPTPAE